jgi:hypothetical protein
MRCDEDEYEYEDEDEDEDEDGPFVCEDCVGDAVLSGEISAAGNVRECDYCKQDHRTTVSILWLAKRVDDVWQALIGEAERFPYLDDDDRMSWEFNGESAISLLGEMMLVSDEGIAEAVLNVLSTEHQFEIHDGGYDCYDTTEEKYVIRLPDDQRYRDLWRSFCDDLKHGRRFFSDVAEERLDEILGPILRGENPDYGAAIRTISPDDENRYVYRARVANDEANRRKIFAAPIKELGPPPPALCTSGRMNVTGIPVFYGSFDVATCVAETRVSVGGSSIVGKFEVVRPLRLLDLSKLSSIENRLSYFHSDYLQAQAYRSFLLSFHDEIKRPVIPGREALEYLPTQVVAEYLWTREENRIDGIVFGSAQMSGDRSNLVLFPHAAKVAGAQVEVPRSIESAFVSERNPEEPDPPVQFVSYRQTESVESADQFPDDAGFEAAENWLVKPVKAVEPEPEPALSFTGTLIRTEVTSIEVRIDEIPVEFHLRR